MANVETPERPIKLALLPDYREEGWASMDLVAEMIERSLSEDYASEIEVTSLVPPFRNRFASVPVFGSRGVARNLDRLLNRFWDYPRSLNSVVKSGKFDLYHIADHSYSQLAHALPSGRVIVTCNDLDTFRCLLDPVSEPRPRWFRAMAGRILSGFQKASVILCISESTRQAILTHGLIPPDRVHTNVIGFASEMTDQPHESADREATDLIGPPGPCDLLHVGTTIPRKRIDILLKIVAAVRVFQPDARLIKIGGALTPEQKALAERLGIDDAIVSLPFLRRETVAAIYRRVTLVLQPSDAEGFGLPVAEALACGAVVVASDIEALREIGGSAATFCPRADPETWSNTIQSLLEERSNNPEAWQARQAAGIARAREFSWSEHASRLMAVYREVLVR